jgi:hypothetical protein
MAEAMNNFTRRTFVTACTGGALASGFSFPCWARGGGPSSMSGISKSQWMDQLMTHPPRAELRRKTSDSPLRLGRFREPWYFLLESISWKPNVNQAASFGPIDVPSGFVTDLASIPTIFWSLLRPDDEYAYAAIVHDYLYWTQTLPKDTADQILKFSMQDFEVPGWKVNTIYRAVSLFGQGAWDSNSRLKKRGEERILKEFPPSGRTRWVDWKNRPDVFAQ